LSGTRRHAPIRRQSFNDEFGDVYGVIYALQTDGHSPAEIKTFADEVRQGLLRLKDVAKVEQFGLQDEKSPVDVVQVRVGGQFTSVEQLREMPIRGTSGNQLRLGGISDLGDPPRHGRPAVGQGASPGQGSGGARRLDGQGRRHHRAGPGAARGGGGHRPAPAGRPA
jgi:hypothetical protein